MVLNTRAITEGVMTMGRNSRVRKTMRPWAMCISMASARAKPMAISQATHSTTQSAELRKAVQNTGSAPAWR